MTSIATLLLNIHNYLHNVTPIKTTTLKNPSPLRVGILSAAAINPIALFDPAATHQDVLITALASRTLSKAQAQITAYDLRDARAYGSYDALLEDEAVEAVYIPLPNGLHAAWALKALEKGKHVLIEKPIASNAAQARAIQQAAQTAGKVAVEAYHWRFCPAAHFVKDLVESGRYGDVREVHAQMLLPRGFIGEGDIRFDFDLGGGAGMDFAYVFSGALYYACPSSSSSDDDGEEMEKADIRVLSASARVSAKDARVDEALSASFSVRTPGREHAVKCTVRADMAQDWLWGCVPRLWDAAPFLSIELEKARIEFPSYVGPWLHHKISITPKDEEGRLVPSRKTSEQCYVGGPVWGDGRGERWWTSYRFQLEAFVEMVRAREGGRTYAGPRVGLGESVRIMRVVDAVYEKAGLSKRGAEG